MIHDETDRITNGRPPDKHTTLTQITPEPQPWGQTMKFSEIRSLKRVHVVNEGIGTENPLEVAGIMNPYTGEWMTIKEAIESRVLDTRTGKIIAKPDGTQLTIEEAHRQGLIQTVIVEALQRPCGVKEHGRNLTLLEAIQRGIHEAEIMAMDPSEKRAKVIHTISVGQGIEDGKIDVNNGTYRLESGELIDIQEAIKKGYLLQHREVKLQTSAVPLSDAINQGLIDERTGWIVDKNTGNKYQVDAAIKCNVLDGDVREIVDPKTDNKVTVMEALDKSIINCKLGKYVLGHEKISFLEAKRRQLIVKPKSLKEVVDDNLMDPQGYILSPLNQEKLTLPEAANRGVLDTDSIRSIFDFRKSELITLNEALRDGIILPDSKFRNSVTGEIISIPEAVSRGYIHSIVVKSIFDIDGFQPPDKSEHISFNAAVSKGFISQKDGGSLLVNKKSGKLLPFTDGVQSGEVKPKVLEYLTQKIGIYENQEELTVLEAVFRGYIDTKTGNLIDIKTHKVVYLNDAIAQNLITPEGASLLNSLLNIIVNTQNTGTIVQRYVTVTNKQIKTNIITYTDALRAGLINNETQMFRDPETNEIVPIVQAISDGKLAPDSESSDLTINTGAIPKVPSSTVITIVSKKETPLPRPSAATIDFITNEKSSLEKQVYELPVEGWSLTDAIATKIFDPVTGLYIIPGTDRLTSFEECINLKIINPSSASVIDPISKRKISITRALEKKILDPTGHYIADGKKISMMEAISKQLIIPEQAMETDQSNQRLLQVTKFDGQPAKVEVSDVIDKNPPQYTELKISEIHSSEPVQIKPGVIYDPATAQVTFADTNETANLVASVVANKIQHSFVLVKDPTTGQKITIDEAFKKNIVDPVTGDYTDNSGRKIKLQDAAKFGIVSVLGSPETVQIKTLKTDTISLDDEDMPSEADKTRARITVEPSFQVKFGRAQSLSPDREAKQVVLQKLRKKSVRPKDAVEKGMIDKETATILEKREIFTAPDGEVITLQEAVDSNKVDGTKGKIVDPQRGDLVNINEAMNRGILDPMGTNELLVPLNRSLSIPELFQQGLIDPESQKVVHPETGAHLSLREAIVCDIVDPLSTLVKKSGDVVTLGKALETGVVDDEKSTVETSKGNVDLQHAVKENIFDDSIPSGPENIPPAGMTFPVAVKRGLVVADKKEITHPITKENIPLKEAIDKDFIMSVPYPVSPESITLEEALEAKLIDLDKSTFTNPKNGDILPISEAVERGLLIIKHPSEQFYFTDALPFVTTTTVENGATHIVTTTTINISPDYIMTNSKEVQNIHTGEIISLEEAEKRGIVEVNESKNVTVVKDIKMKFPETVATDSGTTEQMPIKEAREEEIITGTTTTTTTTETQETKVIKVSEVDTIYDEKTSTFINPNDKTSKLTFEEALEKEIIDPKSVVYDVDLQKPIPVQAAVEKGLLDPKTGQIKDKKSGKNIDFKDAAKKGLIAVVGGIALPFALPVVAGAAAVNAVKEQIAKRKDKTPEKETGNITTTTTSVVTKVVTPTVEISIDQTRDLTPYTIKQAISDRRIEPKICSIKYQGSVLPYTIQDGLDNKRISLDNMIQILDNHTVVLIDVPERLIISKNITPQKLAEMGYFDLKTRNFYDPKTGEYIKFETLIYDLDLFDPDSIYVKDLSKKTPSYVTLNDALRKHLIERNTGYMVDPRTGKKVAFFEAVKLRWIVHKDDLPKAKYQPLTLTEIVDSENFVPESVEIICNEEKLPLIKAITSNIVDPKSVTIKDPKNMQLVPYYEAVDKQIVDPQRGLIVNTATQKTIKFPEAFIQGYVLGIPRPISLQAVIHKGQYDPQTGKFTDGLTKQMITVSEAIDRQIIDDKISEVKDTKANTFVPLEEAIKTNLILPDKGKLKDTATGELVPFDRALQLNLIKTKPIVFNLLQAILLNYYNPKTGRLLNPMTGDEITLQKAIECKLIDPETTKIKDDKRARIVEIKEAIQTKLVDAEQGILTNPILPLDQAYLKGYILSTVLPWSLQETLAQNVYDPKTGQFTINNNNVNMIQAIEGGVINPNILTVKEPLSGDIITLNDAIKLKIIDPVNGQAFDPSSKTEMNLYEAQDKGIIVPYKTQITLPEAVFKGFYDPSTGKFLNPKSKERLKPESAINRGFVDTGSTLVTIDEEIVTFEQAVLEGIIDTNEGVVISEQEPIDFNEAFERGLLVEVRPPIPISEALAKGIYDKESQLFLDPQTGLYLTLMEAIEIKLIDAESVSVKDTRVGIWRKISLVDAILNNYVDGNTGQVRDFSKGDNYEVSLEKAFDLGILVDNKAALSLQRAIHQGLYDENTGKILDTTTDRKVTLHEAVRKFNINPLLPCYYDKKTGVLYSLTDTCRLGIIDKLTGTFKVPHTDEVIKLTEALSRDLIVDIETANFGLYEAISLGLYIPDEGLFIHPATGRKFTLHDACENELINPVTSIVKNTQTNKYVKLPEAIEMKIINPEESIYIFPHGKNIDLQAAKDKGLIVTASTPLTVEEAVKQALYRPDSGKFADPVNGEFYDLKQALKIKFIDPQTTALKDLTNNTIKSLPAAIEQGKIDVEKGRVLDSKSKKTYNLDEALKKGLLITLDKPLEEEFVQKSFATQATEVKTTRECTLEEAIKFELLNPEIAVTKDRQTGRFIPVSNAIQDNQLQVSKMLVFDPPKEKIASVVVTYDQAVPIYLREPLTFSQAIEKNHLDLNTGKFTEPQSNEVLTLKDSISLGFIDPDSVLIKDTNKKKLIKCPEGFRKGLIDADKANILDTATSKLHTLPAALDTGLLVTPNRSFTLIEGITYNFYNPTTGCFTDPFVNTDIINRKKITLGDAIKNNLIDPSSTVVKDTETGEVLPLLNAIQAKLVDPVEGKIYDKAEKKNVDFLKSLERGLLLPAEQWVSLLVTIYLTKRMQRFWFCIEIVRFLCYT